MTKAIGQPIRRKEDHRLLTGQGQFTDDFSAPDQVYMAVVRSPHPHAAIEGMDVAAATSLPGVLGVFTGTDCAVDNLAPVPHSPLPKTDHDLNLRGPGDSDVFIGPHMLLPADKVRHLGEAVAVVIAETRGQALDGAEVVSVSYTELPFNQDTSAAAEGGTPPVWDELPGNTCIDSSFGDAAGTEAAFAAAAHKVKASFHIGRVTGVPMEPRSVLASYDPEEDRYTIHAGSGGAVRQKRELAEVLGVEPDQVRVLSYDVGGNFGTRNRVYVEFGLAAWASRKIGRPVKYTSDRSEAFLSDYQGRDLHTTVELVLDAEGSFLALRADNISNVGARAVSFSPIGKGSPLISGNYRIPAATVRSRAVFTNTVPTQAYRSSGRPEVTFAIERLIEIAARELNMDPLELRRRNLVDKEEMPYTNPIGLYYDSGHYHDNMAIAMTAADWDGRDVRRKDAAARGKLLGVGFANYVESSIGTPVEQTEIYIRPEGHVEVVIGTQPSGQGHETSFAQVAAEWLGLPVSDVRIVIGDTDVVKVGGGSHSGRSMRMAGTVIVMAADELIEEGKEVAAEVLEASVSDIEFQDGAFQVTGTDRSVGWYELAQKSDPGRLSIIKSNEMHTPVFPNGTHICEVEIDPETGGIELTRYTAVDDVGRAINPMIVHGQTHGAIVQGLGQAMVEACVLDPETGQTLSGTLMDYGMLRAGDVPAFQVELNEVPSPTNPLGIKAGGEGGTTGSPAAFTNAIVNALKGYGVTHIEMPATPQRVWRAIQNAKNG
ncbi:MAG: carbon monoxide dehydrogenase [Rhodospirillaceae bacterium]|nr:carbon monoxide dehydrogenase [Rhodospirillaceae bacterium]